MPSVPKVSKGVSSAPFDNYAEVGTCSKTGVPIRLCYHTFGERDAPNGAALLIMGLSSSLQLWDVTFCMQLASCGYYVIRFDNRDVGKSTILVGRDVISRALETVGGGEFCEDGGLTSPNVHAEGARGSTSAMFMRLAYASVRTNGLDQFQQVYSLEDMARDSVGLLDALQIHRAHIVGMCMGGMIAQTIALQYPERVQSLSLMSTHGGSSSSALPSIRVVFGIAKFAIFLARTGTIVPLCDSMVEKRRHGSLTSREKDNLAQAIAQFVASFASGNGSIFPINQEALLRQAHRIVSWSDNFTGFARQYLAMMKAPCRLSQLQCLSVPCVVIHGTDDMLVPYRNGKRLADAIPRARFVSIEGLGHMLHPLARNRVIGALVENMSRSREAVYRGTAVSKL